MKIDLRQGMAQDHPAAISGTVDLQLPAEYQSQTPATFKGTCAFLQEDSYIVKGMLCFEVTGACARCTKPVQERLEVPFEERFVREVNEDSEEEAYPLEGDFLLLDEALNQAALMALPYRLLCDPDCKGLCFRCGANLNLGPCNCKPEPDPRFAALQQLLDKM